MDSYIDTPEGRKRAIELLESDACNLWHKATLERMELAKAEDKKREQERMRVLTQEYHERVAHVSAQHAHVAQVGTAMQSNPKGDAIIRLLEEHGEGALSKLPPDVQMRFQEDYVVSLVAERHATFLSNHPDVQKAQRELDAIKEEVRRLTSKRDAMAKEHKALKEQHAAEALTTAKCHVAQELLGVPVSLDEAMPLFVYKGTEDQYAVALCGCKVLYPVIAQEWTYSNHPDDTSSGAGMCYTNVMKFGRCWAHESLFPLTHAQLWQVLCANMKQQGVPMPKPHHFKMSGRPEPGLHEGVWHGVVFNGCRCEACCEIKQIQK